MPKRDGCENGKNYLYESKDKVPRSFFNGQSATKSRTGKGSTTMGFVAQ